MKLIQCGKCVFYGAAMKIVRGVSVDTFMAVKQCCLNPEPIEVPATHWCGEGMNAKGERNKDLLIQTHIEEVVCDSDTEEEEEDDVPLQ